MVSKMVKYKLRNAIIISSILLAPLVSSPAFGQNHIKELDVVRTSMTEMGGIMPAMIKSAKPVDLRTLERVFEINTYALTTIEAYLKMIKVTLSSNGDINKDVVDVFNGWLEFMNKFCKKDIEYLDEALSETKDQSIVSVITKTKKNITELGNITTRGIEENKGLLR